MQMICLTSLLEVKKIIFNCKQREKIQSFYFHTGVRAPVDFPLKCVANELTSLFPNIMHAEDEISAKIHMLSNGSYT
jgi:hypothetical protein